MKTIKIKKEDYQNNKDAICVKLKDRAKDYYNDNKEKIYQKVKEYRSNKPEKIKEITKRYYDNNKEKRK